MVSVLDKNIDDDSWESHIAKAISLDGKARAGAKKAGLLLPGNVISLSKLRAFVGAGMLAGIFNVYANLHNRTAQVLDALQHWDSEF